MRFCSKWSGTLSDSRPNSSARPSSRNPKKSSSRSSAKSPPTNCSLPSLNAPTPSAPAWSPKAGRWKVVSTVRLCSAKHTYQKVCQVRLHPLVHYAKFCAQSLDILSHIYLERFHVQTILVQHMQRLFFKRESSCLGIPSWLLIVKLHSLAQLFHILSRNICHCVEG